MATSCRFESHRPHLPSLAKRVKAATPEPKAGCPARELRLGKPCEPVRAKRDRRSLSASESEDGRPDGTGYGGHHCRKPVFSKCAGSRCSATRSSALP